MNTEKTSSTMLDWALFLVSTVVLVVLLMYKPEFFWVALPFVFTYLTKALKAM